MTSKQPDLTLYFLNESRAIRIAWLLEELSLPYKLIRSDRDSNGANPPEFKEKVPTAKGGSPVITDGDLVIQESEVITEYLCETYDTSNRFLPSEFRSRLKVKEWMAASEGTFLLHGMIILNPRLMATEALKEHLPALEEKTGTNVHNCMKWLESDLKSGNGKFLVGDELTAADIMMAFSIECILEGKLGTGRGNWPATEKWLDGLMQRDAYKRAVGKTGYRLF